MAWLKISLSSGSLATYSKPSLPRNFGTTASPVLTASINGSSVHGPAVSQQTVRTPPSNPACPNGGSAPAVSGCIGRRGVDGRRLGRSMPAADGPARRGSRRPRRQLVDPQRLLGQGIGDAQLGGDCDGLRQPPGCDELHHCTPARGAATGEAATGDGAPAARR